MSREKLVTKQIARLFRFMIPYGINRFQIIGISEKKVNAIVGWPDEGQLDYDPEEETQEIVWDVQNLTYIDDALDVLEFLFSEGLFDSDKISISEDELRTRMNWDKTRFSNALCDLLQIKVDMIDDGEKTDFFFVHF